jgi:hypothetical protein
LESYDADLASLHERSEVEKTRLDIRIENLKFDLLSAKDEIKRLKLEAEESSISRRDLNLDSTREDMETNHDLRDHSIADVRK